MYCTNCGEKIGFKTVCKKCGYKIKNGNKYCAYCGSSKDEKADICVNCKQKKHSSKFNFIKYILFTIFLIASILGLIVYLQSKVLADLYISIAVLLLAISFLPLWINIIKAIHNNTIRVILRIFKSVCIPLIVVAVIIYGAINSPNDWTAEEASNYAIETYFNTHLKNPSSLQIHDYKVTYSDEATNDNVTIWIKYDYSAQNGLGGYNRDNVTITLLYNIKTDTFSFVSAK